MRNWKTLKLVVAIMVILGMILSSVVVVFANQPIMVTVNGRALFMDTQPVIIGGRTLVPLRAIFEALEATVVWDASTRTITGVKDKTTILLQIDNPVAKIGVNTVTLDVPPTVVGGRTFVPTRFIAESLGADVGWDGQTRTVIITYTPTSPANQELSRTDPILYQRQRMSSREVTVHTQPAVVSIDTHRAHGSGFFVSADGLILTNAHVVRGSRHITVTTYAGEKFPAAIIKIANWSDLALLRINAHSQIRFPFIKDNPDVGYIQQGEEVLAFGSPLGLVGTVTRGIVSAWREKDVAFGAWVDNNIWVIQHDAAMALGNSGGPLLNMYGEWVGVNTLGRADWAGFNFAVPSEQYHSLLQEDIYSLKYDWDSYHTENWYWELIAEDADSLVRQALEIRSIEREIDLLEQSLYLLSNILETASRYQPIYTEIQNLNQLYISMINARITYWTYYMNSRKGIVRWSEFTLQMLHDNHMLATDVYYSARRNLSERFR